MQNNLEIVLFRNICRLVNLSRSVFTGGTSNVGRKQKKFRILGRDTLMEEITGNM